MLRMSADKGKMRALRKGWRKDQRGQTQVEFILTVLTVMFLLFWIWELVMLIYTYNVLADSAKEGVRYAIVHGSGNSNCSGPSVPACPDPTGTNVSNAVTSYAKYSFHDVSAMTVTVNYPDGSCAAPNRVQVVVHYAYKPYITLGWTPPTINAAAEGRVVY